MEMTHQDIEISKTASSCEVLAGSKTVFVRVTAHDVNTLVKNASHNAYRGLGKFSKTFKEAQDQYKSEAVREAIAYADSLLQRATNAHRMCGEAVVPCWEHIEAEVAEAESYPQK